MRFPPPHAGHAACDCWQVSFTLSGRFFCFVFVTALFPTNTQKGNEMHNHKHSWWDLNYLCLNRVYTYRVAVFSPMLPIRSLPARPSNVETYRQPVVAVCVCAGSAGRGLCLWARSERSISNLWRNIFHFDFTVLPSFHCLLAESGLSISRRRIHW